MGCFENAGECEHPCMERVMCLRSVGNVHVCGVKAFVACVSVRLGSEIHGRRMKDAQTGFSFNHAAKSIVSSRARITHEVLEETIEIRDSDALESPVTPS